MLIVMITVLSASLCWVYLQLARRWQIVDHPNLRSSHTQPTPHAGGVPLLLSFFIGWSFYCWLGGYFFGDYAVLILLTFLLMMLGVVDDVFGLSVGLRFGVYTVCALLGAAAVLHQSFVTGGLWLLFVFPLVTLTILWPLNLYNFMDGIDGLAAGRCVLACFAAALFCSQSGGSEFYVVTCSLLGAAHLGFLVLNRPPAKLFMGDAGSVPTGFLLACLALSGAIQGELPLGCWLVLLAVFMVDASWTLVWRILTGQKFTQPHRDHAYQRLSRHWGSHGRTDGVLFLVAVLWLMPIAWGISVFPKFQILLVILAYLPLLVAMAKLRKLA